MLSSYNVVVVIAPACLTACLPACLPASQPAQLAGKAEEASWAGLGEGLIQPVQAKRFTKAVASSHDRILALDFWP